MNNAYAISEPTKEQLRKEGNNVLDDDKRSDAGSVRESIEKTLGEKREVNLIITIIYLFIYLFFVI